MPIDHERLTELFTEAMDLPSTEQAELVAQVSREDAELATELAALLGADDKIVTALRTAGLRPDDASQAALRIPTVPAASLAIPGYRMRGGTLGSGGMGVVYDAEESQPPHRRVAIKVLHVTAPEARARFDAEAQIGKRLAHPGIALEVNPKEPAGGRSYRAQTTSEFARRHRMRAAVNGAFFEPFRSGTPFGDDYYPRSGDPVDAIPGPKPNGTVCIRNAPARVSVEKGDRCAGSVEHSLTAGPMMSAAAVPDGGFAAG